MYLEDLTRREQNSYVFQIKLPSKIKGKNKEMMIILDKAFKAIFYLGILLVLLETVDTIQQEKCALLEDKEKQHA